MSNRQVPRFIVEFGVLLDVTNLAKSGHQIIRVMVVLLNQSRLSSSLLLQVCENLGQGPSALLLCQAVELFNRERDLHVAIRAPSYRPG